MCAADARSVSDGDDDDGASDSVVAANADGDDDGDGASDSIVAVDADGGDDHDDGASRNYVGADGDGDEDDDDDDGGDTKLLPVFTGTVSQRSGDVQGYTEVQCRRSMFTVDYHYSHTSGRHLCYLLSQ